MTDSKPTVTLLAEKGKKYDETRQCISSYEGSIVFLPRDVSIGQIVRVELTPVTEKKDARGAVMYQAQHAWFDLGRDERRAIAREAEVLRSCEVFGEAEALALLAARFGKVLEEWKGYSHYYFHKSGAVYAGKYPPATLVLFETFAGSPAKGLIEPLLWISAGTKPKSGDLFALRTEGKEIEWRFDIPQLTDEEVGKIVARIEKGEPLLSAPLVTVGPSGKFNVPGWEENEWRKASFPTLAVPDFAADETATIPDIVEFAYGREVESNSLVAYGVIGAWESWGEIHFAAVWNNTWAEAEAARDKATSLLAKFREKLEADRIRAEEEARQKAETAAAVAEVQRKAEALEREKAELTEAVERGEALLNFEVFVHTSGQRGDGGGYVIRPDGSLRECDRHQYERSHGRGRHDMVWEVVRPEETALEWQGFRTTADDRARVCKAPVPEYTQEQVATMQRLAGEHEIAAWEGAPDWKPNAPKMTPKAESNKAAEDLGVDPNHPFAKLAALREQMSGK